MTDRELLELAARAVGWRITGFAPAYMCPRGTDLALIVVNDQGGESVWNPLADDGDALRLAVKLGIKVMPYPVFEYEKHSVIASRRWWAPPDDDDNTYIGPEVVEVYGTDHLAATRRAIVRAAAEIGKDMK